MYSRLAMSIAWSCAASSATRMRASAGSPFAVRCWFTPAKAWSAKAELVVKARAGPAAARTTAAAARRYRMLNRRMVLLLSSRGRRAAPQEFFLRRRAPDDPCLSIGPFLLHRSVDVGPTSARYPGPHFLTVLPHP